MATYNGPLTKAPAREALIDIQFAPAITEEAVKNFNELAQGRFERSLPIWETIFGCTVNPDGKAQQPPPETKTGGIRLESTSPPHVLQCRTNGFTFSRLSPYGSWDELKTVAKFEWDQFLTVAPQLVIHRIAVRYINELRLPMPFKDFEEYLSCPPEVPSQLPQAISSFLQRIVIPDPDNNCTSIITQALDESGQSPMAHLTVLLDIDVFRIVEIASTDTERVWQELDQLRMQKNKMFFAHITDKMVDLLI